uniref:Uncharacterized protein n=1 Tax=viral metagenome TaxID=1070528 RepID=A0A6H1ZSQ9_9ZZZZ
MASHAHSIPVPDAQFRTWWIAAKTIDATIDTLDLSDEQVEQLQSEKHGLEGLIASRKAAGRVGVLVKARLLHRKLSDDLDEFGADLAQQIIRHLERAQ